MVLSINSLGNSLGRQRATDLNLLEIEHIKFKRTQLNTGLQDDGYQRALDVVQNAMIVYDWWILHKSTVSHQALFSLSNSPDENKHVLDRRRWAYTWSIETGPAEPRSTNSTSGWVSGSMSDPAVSFTSRAR